MKKPLFGKVCIVGVGLMGGSLGMAIKKKKLARWVIGVARQKKTIAEAFRKKAIDVGVLDIREGVKDADLVILCTPVFEIIRQMSKIKPHLSGRCLVIDVGSSKFKINRAARQYFNVGAGSPRPGRGNLAPTFVGCHPMAGSEKQGVSFAEADLFEGAACFVTKAHPKAESFWRSLGAKPIRISAKDHDAWVAKTSHLPHLLSFALFQKMHRGDPPGRPYVVNPSLRDLARLAKSDPEIWADVFLSNCDSTLDCLKEFQRETARLTKAMRKHDKAAIVKFISSANRNAQKI